jgi:hypothetical protein
MRLTKLFTEHPASVGETYGQHLRSAGTFAIRLLIAGAACLTHAVLPFLFKHTASRFVRELHGRMITNRNRLECVSRGK